MEAKQQAASASAGSPIRSERSAPFLFISLKCAFKRFCFFIFIFLTGELGSRISLINFDVVQVSDFP